MTVAQSSGACPLCGRDKWMGVRAKMLYGHPVCSKCYYGFANRRQFAFVVDLIIWFVVLQAVFLGTGVTDPD